MSLVPLASPSSAGAASSAEWWRWMVYGIGLAVFGIIGDLSISLLKRDMQRKDSGDWLPGLGGALDVIDSVYMAAPIAFLFWVLELVH